MSIDGTWKITTKTPIGDQQATAALTTSGSELTGTLTGMFGVIPIEDGRVEGDKAYFTAKASSPMPLTLKHEATFDGDTVTGVVDTGMFGKATFSGHRVP